MGVLYTEIGLSNGHLSSLDSMRASTLIIELQRSIRRYIRIMRILSVYGVCVRTVHISIPMVPIGGKMGGGAAQRRKQRLRLKKLALI